MNNVFSVRNTFQLFVIRMAWLQFTYSIFRKSHEIQFYDILLNTSLFHHSLFVRRVELLTGCSLSFIPSLISWTIKTELLTALHLPKIMPSILYSMTNTRNIHIICIYDMCILVYICAYIYNVQCRYIFIYLGIFKHIWIFTYILTFSFTPMYLSIWAILQPM